MKFYIKINTENCLIDELKRKLRTLTPFTVLIVILNPHPPLKPIPKGGLYIIIPTQWNKYFSLVYIIL